MTGNLGAANDGLVGIDDALQLAWKKTGRHCNGGYYQETRESRLHQTGLGRPQSPPPSRLSEAVQDRIYTHDVYLWDEDTASEAVGIMLVDLRKHLCATLLSAKSENNRLYEISARQLTP